MAMISEQDKKVKRQHLFWAVIGAETASIGLGVGAGLASLGRNKLMVGLLGAGSGITLLLSLAALWQLQQMAKKKEQKQDALLSSGTNSTSTEDYSSLCFGLTALTMTVGIGSGAFLATTPAGHCANLAWAGTFTVGALLMLACGLVSYAVFREGKEVDSSSSEASAQSKRDTGSINDFALASALSALITVVGSVVVEIGMRKICGIPGPSPSHG